MSVLEVSIFTTIHSLHCIGDSFTINHSFGNNILDEFLSELRTAHAAIVASTLLTRIVLAHYGGLAMRLKKIQDAVERSIFTCVLITET